MQFSLDRKGRSHKQNQCSASDSVGLIFTRSYRFTLLITTPTTTPSPVKAAFRLAMIGVLGFQFRCIILKLHTADVLIIQFDLRGYESLYCFSRDYTL